MMNLINHNDFNFCLMINISEEHSKKEHFSEGEGEKFKKLPIDTKIFQLYQFPSMFINLILMKFYNILLLYFYDTCLCTCKMY